MYIHNPKLNEICTNVMEPWLPCYDLFLLSRLNNSEKLILELPNCSNYPVIWFYLPKNNTVKMCTLYKTGMDPPAGHLERIKDSHRPKAFFIISLQHKEINVLSPKIWWLDGVQATLQQTTQELNKEEDKYKRKTAGD